jgi:hypothetical protein
LVVDAPPCCRRLIEGAITVAKMTPEQEAAYALDYKLEREGLSKEVQAEYDRLLQERFFAASRGEGQHHEPPPPRVPARTPPEVRARVLEMFKRGNRKYALPFEQDRLAVMSVMGGNWEEYGQVVLQMAILDTLLSIEERLAALEGDGEKAHQNAPQGNEADS